jgi:hypothetical protein
MNNRSVQIDLPDDVWKVIYTQFKPLSEGGDDSDILRDIIMNHLSEHAYYPDIDSLTQGQGMKDHIDIQEDMIMALIDLLERKGIATHQEWTQIMHDRIMTEE